jgi:ADP-ribose pyrophosphatase YjhB (NUDIX family)
MYKVFFNDRVIYLNDHCDGQLRATCDFVWEYTDFRDLKIQLNHFLSNYRLRSGCFYYKKKGTLFSKFLSLFDIVEAAGGLVRNQEQDVLVIRRFERWDLPKGHVEKREDIQHAAVREVTEECGLQDVKILRSLPTTYHCYEMNFKKVMKRTYWFEMICEKDEILIPQTEEGITEVRWFKPNELEEVTKSTYSSLIDIFKCVKIDTNEAI